MAATLSGSTITFTGVDANPSTLGAIVGVTTITVGGCTIYNCGALNITFSGDTTIDPRFYQIITTGTVLGTPLVVDSANVAGTGIIRAGMEYASSFGGGILYTRGIAIQTSGAFNTNSSATLIVRGATLKFNGAASNWWNWNGTLDAVNMILDSKQGINQRLRLGNANYKNHNPIVVGFQADNLFTPSIGTDLKNPYSENVGVGQELVFGSSANEFKVYGVPKTAGNVLSPFSNWQGRTNPKLYDSEAGTDIIIMPDACGDSSFSGHGGLIYARYQIGVQDNANTPINDGVVFLRDTNNSKRKIKGVGAARAILIDNTADQVHINTLAGGLTAVKELMTAHIYRNNAVGDISAPDGQEIHDLRSKSNAKGNDNFDLHYWAYKYQYQKVSDLQMRGLTVVKNTVVTAVDTTVTKTEAQVAALTEVNNLDDFVDYCKYHKTRPLAANLEYPTIGTHFISLSGSAIDLGNHNLVIDSAAVAPVAITAETLNSVTTYTIIIKSTGLAEGVRYKSIKTTQLITGNITASYTDSTKAGYITVTDTSTLAVDLRKASDNTVIATRSGDGQFAVAPTHVGASVYFATLQNGQVVLSTIRSPITLAAGDNGSVSLTNGYPTAADIAATTAQKVHELDYSNVMPVGSFGSQIKSLAAKV